MRPNFILFTTDQQRADHLGCYGNDIIRTPNIDAIGQFGTIFDNFYVASPVCMANRASIMTGCMPSVHGVRSNGIPLPLRRTTMCDLLRAAGYKTALIGKAHLQNMSGKPPEVTRFEAGGLATLPPDPLLEADKTIWQDGRYDSEDIRFWTKDENHSVSLPYYGFDHVELCTMHGDMVHGDYYRWLSERTSQPDALRGPLNAISDSRYILPQAYRTRVPEELYPTRYIEERTIEYLESTRETPDSPFMIHCSFPDPHHPFTPPGRYWDLYNPNDVAAPVSLLSNHGRTAPVEALHRQRVGGSAVTNSTTPFAVSEREAREAIALTYGMISMIDDSIGRIMRRLSEIGLSDRTIVIFMSDHGDFMGDHGLLLKAALHYRGLIRIPFIWFDPMSESVQKSISMPASTIDLAPTILGRAGLSPFYGMQGLSLLPFINGAESQRDRSIIIEEDGHAATFGLTHPVRARSVLTRTHRLTIYTETDWTELYDFRNDPNELNNLASDPAYGDQRTFMFESLARGLSAIADRNPFPTGRA